MKLLAFLALILLSSFLEPQKRIVNVPSGEVVELRFSAEESTEVTIHNLLNSTLQVQVQQDSNREFVKGFGLDQNSKEMIWVESDEILILKNDSEKTIEVSYEKSTDGSKEDQQSDGVNLTFHNGSMVSIPLFIPGVMNPNLNPKSNSSVTLKYGQRVYFKEKGKQYLLFEVDQNFINGDILEIQDLIKARKKQLGL